ncbi:hypothetical protein DB346_06730 [Verrucomicrobia bacterium LW23]|nr:hypothetical protein DB346_06730 [Verrucomicrobia bacterium LW23]
MKTMRAILSLTLLFCVAFTAVASAADKPAATKAVVKDEPRKAGTSNARYPQQRWPADFEKILNNPPPDMLLYSLEPLEGNHPKEEGLHGFKVLGKMTMYPEQARAAVDAFQDAIDNWDSKMAKCFKPRQALVVNSGGNRYELLLCYSCHVLKCYRNGELVRNYGVNGSPAVLKNILRRGNQELSTTDPSKGT